MSRFAGVVTLALVLALLAAPGALQAQRHGGSAVGGGMARGGAVAPQAHNAFTGTRPSPVIPPVVSPVIRPPGRSFVPGARSVAPNFRKRNVIVAPGFGFGYGFGYGLGYPYYSPYYPGYADPNYSASPYYSEPQYVPPAVPDTSSPSQNELDLSYQVAQLSQQVEQLRQQQAQAQAQAPPRPVAPEPAPMPTVLVFRDGHRMEITNYAIVGQTIWVLDERNSTRIPVSDLDVDATQKENRIRGLRFQVH